MISFGIHVINAIIFSSRIWFALEVVKGAVEVAHRALDLYDRLMEKFHKNNSYAVA
jgi:hypothetical protein